MAMKRRHAMSPACGLFRRACLYVEAWVLRFARWRRRGRVTNREGRRYGRVRFLIRSPVRRSRRVRSCTSGAHADEPRERNAPPADRAVRAAALRPQAVHLHRNDLPLPVWGDVETRRTIVEPRVAVQSPARAVPVTLPRKTEY
ncbi:hypothetical protein BVI434_850067 [Burkholderia vietnamiensis]|nr:hypothetical protein BVI434_850067 [Burkholderia vietnamiensis]